MLQIESLLLKHCSRRELFSGLEALLEKLNNGGSPSPVICTKKLYNAIIKHVDTVRSYC